MKYSTYMRRQLLDDADRVDRERRRKMRERRLREYANRADVYADLERAMLGYPV